jgi:hypothetical protein
MSPVFGVVNIPIISKVKNIVLDTGFFGERSRNRHERKWKDRGKIGV